MTGPYSRHDEISERAMTVARRRVRQEPVEKPGVYETWGDFWKALAVAVLLVAALYCLVLVAAAAAMGPAKP